MADNSDWIRAADALELLKRTMHTFDELIVRFQRGEVHNPPER
jgi:hypothetical protein